MKPQTDHPGVDLRRIVYCSRVGTHVRFRDVRAMVHTYGKRNARVGITGHLLYSPRHFVQVIEGPDAVVCRLFDRIRGDRRHAEQGLISNSSVSVRLFPGTPMGLSAIGGLHDASGQLIDPRQATVELVISAIRTAQTGVETRLTPACRAALTAYA